MNLDPYIIEFVSGNWLALSLALGVLKVIAKMTPWAHDDEILQVFTGIFSQVRKK
jgi:hypothetical protein